MKKSGAAQVQIGHMVVLLYLQPRELGARMQKLLASKIALIADRDSAPDAYGHISIIRENELLFTELLGAREGEVILCKKWGEKAAEIRVCRIIPLHPSVLRLLQTPQHRQFTVAA